MAQIFHRSANSIARFSLLFAVLAVTLGLAGVLDVRRALLITPGKTLTAINPSNSAINITPGTMASIAGIATAEWKPLRRRGNSPYQDLHELPFGAVQNSAYLEPVRESYRTDKSIVWVKVHRLPDFVYFNHSIHVNKGIGCSSCHGQVEPDAADVSGQRIDHAVVPGLPSQSGKEFAAARSDHQYGLAAAGQSGGNWQKNGGRRTTFAARTT